MGIVYKSSEIVDRITKVAKLRGVSKRRALLDCGFGQNTLENMKTSMPSASKLAIIADRLECSVDYLLGRTTEILTPGTGQAPAPSALPQGEEDVVQAPISGKAAEMLTLYTKLSGEEQDRLIGRLELMVEQQGDKKDATPIQSTGSGSSVAKVI